ncbi:MAG: acylneuraminate cytidylyltransferase family protein [Alphaproteobacteria bacterium]|nr:acylneuraminate cytidylyltransferase family protein [Alphaproteobacteria bacterium]
MSKNICIILARGGSKGLPGKNIKPLAGKPLIAHTIGHAQESGLFSHIVVSSDDTDILSVAEQYGAIPLKRPDDLASDTIGSMPSVKHALLRVEEKTGTPFNTVTLLQPTSPLRLARDITGAMNVLKNGHADNVVSVTSDPPSPYYTVIEQQSSGGYAVCKPAHIVRRQDAPPVYQLNGAIYIWQRAFFTGTDIHHTYKNLTEKTDIYVMPPERSFDIDTQLDFDLCVFMLERRKNEETAVKAA